MERKQTYIRAWREAGGADRKSGGYSLEDMVGRLAVIGVATTGASLSRIERGIQPYNQDMLDAIAAALGLEPWQLLKDNPAIPPAKVIDFLPYLTKDEIEQADKVLRAMFGERAG